jgi:hypothetical protein
MSRKSGNRFSEEDMGQLLNSEHIPTQSGCAQDTTFSTSPSGRMFYFVIVSICAIFDPASTANRGRA